METIFKNFLFTICFVIYTFTLQGQNTINTSGSNGSGYGGTIAYSIGQVCNSSFAGNTGSVIQGVQQPYEISVVTEIKNTTGIRCSVFPNPVSTYLQIEISNYSLNNLNYALYDNSGRLLKTVKIESSVIKLDMSSYDKSGYLLKINDNDNSIKVFKIIKK